MLWTLIVVLGFVCPKPCRSADGVESARTGPAPPDRRRAAAERVEVTTEGGALGAVGLLGKPAARGGFVGFGSWHPSGFGPRLRAVRLVTDPTTSSGARMKVDLWAVLAAACWKRALSSRSILSSCLELGWGRQRGKLKEPANNQPIESRPWLAFGPSLTMNLRLFGPLEASLTGTLAGRLGDQRFAFDVQPGHDDWAIGGYLGLGLALRWPPAPRSNAR